MKTQSFIVLGTILFVQCLSFVFGKNLMGRNAAPKSTLVILDDASDRAVYSSFLKDLEQRNHELNVIGSSDSVKLEEFGEWKFDNIVLLAENLAKTATLFKTLPAFIENDGNILLGLSSASKLPKYVSKYLESVGVDIHPVDSKVVDHFSNFDGNASLVKTDQITKVSYVAGSLSKSPAPIAFAGVAMDVADDNYLAVKILSAESTAYSVSAEKSKNKIHSAGSKTLLVAGIQARNNARIVVSGSTELFSDKFFSKASANKEFCSAISKWAFQESGVLRASDIRHHRADGRAPDPMLKAVQREDLPFSLYPDPEIARESLTYRIKDSLTYAFNVSEYKDGKWVPFKADDVQLEFVMLDPYVRKTMSHDGKGKFHVTFTAPDAYGIYHFRVMYRRPGLSVLHFTTQVSLRPFKHDEYERFITMAFPYYSSALTLMFGFFLFSIMFLFGK